MLNKTRNFNQLLLNSNHLDIPGGFSQGGEMKFFGEIAAAVMVVSCTECAIGAVCDAGTYLQDDTCVSCGTGFYCPGDDLRYNCPTDTTDWRQVLTDMGYEVLAIEMGGPWSWTYEGTNNVSTVIECHTGVTFSTSIGRGYTEPWFNGTAYVGDLMLLWFHADTGYYLSSYWGETWAWWYNTLKPCTNLPANAHYTGPGTPDAPDGSVIDANDCPWACDDGWGRVDNSCVPLCDKGIIYLHAGDMRVPLFPRTYSSPALAVELDGQVCYGVLRPGRASGAINIDVGGVVYHGE